MSSLVELSCSSARFAAAEFRHDALRKYLAEFHAPLVEGFTCQIAPCVNDDVLVERDQPAERRRCQALEQRRVRRPVALEGPCGTSQSGEPSAFTSAAVLPNASASPCAKTFATSRSWCRPSAFSGLAKAMKSQGIRRVPWWMSW